MKRVAVTLFFLTYLCIGYASAECTGLYVGKKCSVSGTTIIGRCNDMHPLVTMPYVEIVEAVKGVPGRKVTGINGFEWPLPADTYRYVSVPYPDASDYGIFASALTNEYGLAMTATVTGYYCAEAAKADPNVSDGVAEETVASILAACCKTAREAVDLLARIVDEKGSAEQNIVMICDGKEAWYFEIYTGHQYCAVRMPEDCVAVFGNEFMLETVDSKDAVCSKNLFTLPKRKGFAVYAPDGKMNLRETYMGKGRLYDFSHQRTWAGHRLLSPSTVGDYKSDGYLPLFFKPDSKVSLTQAMDLFRSRFEGTPLCPDETGRRDIRTIAAESQQEVHLIEVYDNLPSEMSCVTWLALSEASFAPFVPISNAIQSCSERYGRKAPEFVYDKGVAQCLFKRLNSICGLKRDYYGKSVRAYWSAEENYLADSFPQFLWEVAGIYANDPAVAKRLLTLKCTGIQQQAADDAQRLFDDLIWHIMLSHETIAYDCNFDDLSLVPMPEKPFEARFDVARTAERNGWTVIPDEGERSAILQRDGVSIKITASDGHRLNPGAIELIEGNFSCDLDKPVQVTWEDGRLYLPLSFFSCFD